MVASWPACPGVIRGCGGRGATIYLAGLRPVLGAGLLAVGDAGGVERAAHDLVTDARQVLHPPAADQHHRVLLEVVALAGDVGGDLHPVREPHTGHLSQRRVGLLRRRRIHARAYPPPLGRRDPLLASLTGLQAGGRDLLLGPATALADELVDAGHAARDGSNAPRAGCRRRNPSGGATATTPSSRRCARRVAAPA